MSHRSSPRPSSMGRRRIATTEEQDVHTGWRRAYTTFKRAGQSAKAKRRTRRRERTEAKRELRKECCHPDFHVLGVHAPGHIPHPGAGMTAAASSLTEAPAAGAPAAENELFAPFPGTAAEMFIQWKGTNVCLDFHCPCQPEEDAFSSHFDGYGAYHLRCGRCGAVYELGTQVRARRVPADEVNGQGHDLVYDEEVLG